jgi:hypothetical protein
MPANIVNCEEKSNQPKIAHFFSIIRHAAQTQQVELVQLCFVVQLYFVVAWP